MEAAGLEPLHTELEDQRPHSTSQPKKQKNEKQDGAEIIYTLDERPLLVFEGGAAGEPAWKKALIIFKYYGLLVLGFFFFALFLGVRINEDDPYSDHQSFTLGVALMMTCWWLSTSVPIAVTSLLPIVLFPITGVLSSSVTTAQYANEICFLLAGSFMLALSMERWRLDRRIVYKFLAFMGVGKKRILAIVMFSTAMLSMWMSNAATALVMVGIIHTLSKNVLLTSKNKYLVRRIERAYLLGVLYGAAIGGICTPIGTSSNLVSIRSLRRLYPASPEINFGMWMAFGIPTAIIAGVIAWTMLSWRYLYLFGGSKTYDDDDDNRYQEMVDDVPTFDEKKEEEDIEENRNANYNLSVTEIFRKKYEKLGPMKPAEYIICFAWGIAIFLWIFRSDITFAGTCEPWNGCIPGWSRIFTDRLNLTGYERKTPYVADAVPILFIGILMFLLPAGDGKGSRVLDWGTIRNLPWSVLLLIGGGFALAEAFSTSGLARYMATGLYNGLSGASVYGVMTTLTIVVALLAIVATSTSVVSVIVPVFAELALRDNVHPFMYVIPATFVVSFSLVLPTSTPVNAVIFSTQKIDIPTMFKWGMVYIWVGILLIILGWLAIGQWSFRAKHDPIAEDWITAAQLGDMEAEYTPSTPDDIHVGI
eukprot:TRINITY_DN15688_c0_g1_i1.p1 TRINITY_DN15688_c0_g1~~TRINITY_DN15688_c0_g1_i1.p1  ORF type:complete len:654 (-),score=126.50 TRINITY_DN15688_c0_g1_i1:69-2009(-)